VADDIVEFGLGAFLDIRVCHHGEQPRGQDTLRGVEAGGTAAAVVGHRSEYARHCRS
jgi:hypothetical protein